MQSAGEFVTPPVYTENEALLPRRILAGREVIGTTAVGTLFGGPELAPEPVQTAETTRTPDMIGEATWRNFGHDTIKLSGLVVLEQRGVPAFDADEMQLPGDFLTHTETGQGAEVSAALEADPEAAFKARRIEDATRHAYDLAA